MKQIKMTIVVSEVGHPALFRELEKVEQPRARALLFKRLAEEGARPVSHPQQQSGGYHDASISSALPESDAELAEWFK